jgi:hypothetical protein
MAERARTVWNGPHNLIGWGLTIEFPHMTSVSNFFTSLFDARIVKGFAQVIQSE